MTQPAYRFLEDVPNVSATGAMADLTVHQGGTEPIVAPFNANNMIILAVLANHEARLNSIDTIVSGTVSADETIFESFTSDFVNFPQVISDMKGSIFNWYDTLTSSGYSNYDLYHKNTFTSGAEVTGGDLTVETIITTSGGYGGNADIITSGAIWAKGGLLATNQCQLDGGFITEGEGMFQEGTGFSVGAQLTYLDGGHEDLAVTSGVNSVTIDQYTNQTDYTVITTVEYDSATEKVESWWVRNKTINGFDMYIYATGATTVTINWLLFKITQNPPI